MIYSYLSYSQQRASNARASLNPSTELEHQIRFGPTIPPSTADASPSIVRLPQVSFPARRVWCHTVDADLIVRPAAPADRIQVQCQVLNYFPAWWYSAWELLITLTIQQRKSGRGGGQLSSLGKPWGHVKYPPSIHVSPSPSS